MRTSSPPAERFPRLQYHTLVPSDAAAEKSLRSRTLTALYNEKPQWLLDAHARLDRAVAQAYVAATDNSKWVSAVTAEQFLELLLAENLARAGDGAVQTSDE